MAGQFNASFTSSNRSHTPVGRKHVCTLHTKVIDRVYLYIGENTPSLPPPMGKKLKKGPIKRWKICYKKEGKER
jgi:hypothetical protein